MTGRAVRQVVIGLCVAGVIALPTQAAAVFDERRGPRPLPLPSSSVRWVSPAGHDAGPGTKRRPWRTVGRALEAAGPGTTIYLRAGSYVEQTSRGCGSAYNALNWTRSGTPSAPITLSGAPGEASRVVVGTLLNIHGDWLQLQDLVVDANRSFSSFDDRCTGSVNVAIYGKHVTLQHVTVQNGRMSGVYINDAEDVSIVRSLIQANGSHPDLDHGIYVSSVRRLLLANNVIVDNLAYGVQFYKNETLSPRMIHNTVARNGRSGLVLSGDVSGARVANNIFAWNRDYGIRDFELDGKDNIAVANLFFGNRRSVAYLTTGRFTATQSFVGNPSFSGRGRRDYRLRRSSPALDRAVSGYATAYDFDGKRRRGSADLGAYEFGP